VLLKASWQICEHILPALTAVGLPPLCWCDGARLVLPSDTVRTLVLQKPAALTLSDQQALHTWMVTHPGVQTITLTPKGLYRLVRAGYFLAELYYELNVVMISA
jgi:hypothetical protein